MRRVVGLLTIALLAGCGDRATLSIPATVELPTGREASLWAAGVSDVYAGSGETDNLWHFDGAGWDRLHVYDGELPMQVFYFAGTGPDDVWLSDLFHYDGDSWTANDPSQTHSIRPIGCGPDGKLRGVGGVPGENAEALYRADGDVWTRVLDLPADLISAPWIDPTTGYVFVRQRAGQDTTRIRRFDGKRWDTFELKQYYNSLGFFGVGDGAVYVTAVQGDGKTIEVLRFDGTRWASIYSGNKSMITGNSPLHGAGGTQATGPLLGGEGAVYRVSASGLTPVITDDTMIFQQVQVVDGYLVLHGEYKKAALGTALLIRELPN